MEYWIIGFDGLRSIYNLWHCLGSKIGPNSAFDPQYSIGYLVVAITSPGWTKAWPSGPGLFAILKRT
jgi:hypothetical protein